MLSGRCWSDKVEELIVEVEISRRAARRVFVLCRGRDFFALPGLIGRFWRSVSLWAICVYSAGVERNNRDISIKYMSLTRPGPK